MTRRRLRAPRRPLAVLVAVVATASLTGACSDLTGTDGKTWITGEGSVEQVAIAERGEPVEANGEDLEDQSLDLAAYRGKVVVINVYAAWCPPCRSEMGSVVQLANQADPAQVAYLGVNIRDDQARAQSFGRSFDIDFPSFYDPSSSVLLSLSDQLGPYSLPSTVVLDRDGRVAALVLGKIPSVLTIQDVVDDVVAEAAPT